MTDSPVLLDLTDGVATITLNRPDAMNSLDVATKVALLETVRTVAEDPAARCVVLTGTGRALLRRPGPQGAHRDPAERVERVAVPHRRRALQPDRDRARDDAEARGRRASTGSPPAPAPAWRSPATCGSWPTRPATTWRSPTSRSPATPARATTCSGWSAGPRRSSCSTSRARSRPRSRSPSAWRPRWSRPTSWRPRSRETGGAARRRPDGGAGRDAAVGRVRRRALASRRRWSSRAG